MLKREGRMKDEGEKLKNGKMRIDRIAIA